MPAWVLNTLWYNGQYQRSIPLHLRKYLAAITDTPKYTIFKKF